MFHIGGMILASPRYPGSREATEAKALAVVARVLTDHHATAIDTRDVRRRACVNLCAVGRTPYGKRWTPLAV